MFLFINKFHEYDFLQLMSSMLEGISNYTTYYFLQEIDRRSFALSLTLKFI